MRKFYLILFAAAALVAAACEKNPAVDPTPVTPTESTTDPVMATLTDSQINGTSIGADMTVAGLVKNVKTGQGIAGVNVTDGYGWARTDANGVYQMKTNDLARKIYITTPAAFKIGQSSDGHPNFFTKKNIERGKKYRVDFFLEPLDAAETEFTLFAIGDPQCRNTAEVARYTTETIKKIKQDAADAGHVYAVTLGDVTFDSNDTYYPMYSSMKNVKAGSWTIPFFQCMGNHDHDATKVVSTDDQPTMQYKAQGTYVSYFGPQDYSFDRGDAHIIVMDNVWVYGSSSTSNSNKVTCSYYSGFSDQQYAWLQQDIANVENPASKVVLLCCHIPFRGGGSKTGSNMNKDKHYADVLTLMKQFNEAHIMIGHTHYNQNYIHTAYTTKNGQPVYEHIHGAACGAWWASNSNVTGGPNGFTAYHFNGPTIRNWQGMNTNFENSFQLRVYDGNQEFSGSKGYRLKWSNTSNTVNSLPAPGFAAAANAFVVEVFNDDKANWKVEFWQNGAKAGDFVRAAESGICNVPLVAFWFNEKNKTTDTWTSKTASHYWYYKPASGIPSSEKNWEVRAYHTIPASGQVNTYTASKLTTDYSTF